MHTNTAPGSIMFLYPKARLMTTSFAVEFLIWLLIAASIIAALAARVRPIRQGIVRLHRVASGTDASCEFCKDCN
jgi:hypothetical protein